MKILVIEDEIPASRRIIRLIGDLLPGAEIVQTIDSIEEAVDYLSGAESPDLIFMDIQLADGISFEIFNRVEVKSPVIFTTAYDHYAVRAFKVNSIDYLLKPVEEHELKRALDRYRTIHSQALTRFSVEELMRTLQAERERYKKRFLVKTAGRLTFILIEDIAYFFSDDGNTFLVTKDGNRFLVEVVLDELEQQINPEMFFRINRKMLVSLTCIQRIEPYFNNRYLLVIDPTFDEEVIVSRQRGTEFKKWLDQ